MVLHYGFTRRWDELWIAIGDGRISLDAVWSYGEVVIEVVIIEDMRSIDVQFSLAILIFFFSSKCIAFERFVPILQGSIFF